jgi:hypothetical protein
VVWGDGKKVESQIIKATDTSATARGSCRFRSTPAARVWVRMSVWDSAGNGRVRPAVVAEPDAADHE